MVNDLNVEELLIQTNPVLDPEELRLTASEVDARCASILERRGAMQTQTPSTERQIQLGESRRWRKPALAFMVSLLVILVAAGGAALLVGGSGDPDVIDEPTVTTATTTPPTTTPATLPTPEAVGPIVAPGYAEVPSFSAVVEYYEHDPALGDPGWEATVAIKHAGPMLYEAEVLTGGPPYLGQPGSLFVGDGAVTWLSEMQGEPFFVTSDFDHFGHLYFDSGRPNVAWDEACASADVIGPETLIGRATTHIACATTTEDYELWVDEETGIVVRLSGPLGIGDLSPFAARDGGFVFAELTLGPVSIAAPPQVQTAEPGELPPFHLVRNQWPGVVEYWYRDASTLRETFIEAEDSGWIGTYLLIANGRLAGCTTHPSEPDCWDHPLEDAGETYPVGMPYTQVPLELVEASCALEGSESVAGRSTDHFVCEGVEITMGDTYYAIDNPAARSEYWYDADTGILLRTLGTGRDVDATLLELNPVFDPEIFVYDELIPQPPALQVGDLAPLWSGPLLDVGFFDVEAHRGSLLVVFNWFPGCGDGCFDGLDLMQRVHDQYGGEVVVVTVSEDTRSETARVLERRSNTVPAVYCVAGESGVGGEDTDPACTTPEPGVDPWDASPWFLWGNPIPSTTVIDESGIVIGVFTRSPDEYEAELAALLADIAGVNP